MINEEKEDSKHGVDGGRQSHRGWTGKTSLRWWDFSQKFARNERTAKKLSRKRKFQAEGTEGAEVPKQQYSLVKARKPSVEI